MLSCSCTQGPMRRFLCHMRLINHSFIYLFTCLFIRVHESMTRSGPEQAAGWYIRVGPFETEVIKVVSFCYPHMPIGKVWIYRLLFVYLYGYEFFRRGYSQRRQILHDVRRRPRQGISHFCELCSPEAHNRTAPTVLPACKHFCKDAPT